MVAQDPNTMFFNEMGIDPNQFGIQQEQEPQIIFYNYNPEIQSQVIEAAGYIERGQEDKGQEMINRLLESGQIGFHLQVTLE